MSSDQAANPIKRKTWSLPQQDGVTYPDIEVIRFGKRGTRPKVYMQAGLHADELPGMLVLKKLAKRLEEHASRGNLQGEIVLVPVCNPIGLSQTQGGYLVGRVEKSTDRNFNRGFPDLFAAIKDKVGPQLTDDDPEKNVQIVRDAIRDFVDDLEADDAFTALQNRLFREASSADIVLDVHADNEALLHLYVDVADWPKAKDLAAELDARAVLLTDQSGGNTFDEANGHVWVQLAGAYPDKPLPLACFAATVELRSNNDVSHEDADRDARALERFLMRRGFINEEPGSLPRLLCDAGPIRAMQQVRAPIDGLIVYARRLGDTVRQGDLIAEIIPPHGGDAALIEATTDGVLFARHDQRWAYKDKVIGKVAGHEELAERQGFLLSD